MKMSNTAALRKALELFVEYSELVCHMGIFTRDRLVEIIAKARTALATPARNCDKFNTPEEALRKLRLRITVDRSVIMAIQWLYTPAENAQNDAMDTK